MLVTNKQNKKICIYLDQFAVSNMIDSQHGTIWNDIKLKIQKLHKTGIIFCPKSNEHYLETSRKSFENSLIHDSFFDEISDGYCFKVAPEIIAQLISSRIRKNNITHKTYLYENIKNILNSEINKIKFDELNQKFNELINYSVIDTNTFRKNVPNQNMTPDIKLIFLKTLKKIESDRFIQRLKKLDKHGYIMIRGDKFENEELPNWIDSIINLLLNKHKFKRDEIKKLIIEFERFGFENISVLNIRTSLFALSSIYSKKEAPSDHLDILRISTGLAFSDYMFTDKKRKNELVELKFVEKYNCKIFSGTNEDLVKFLEQLNLIDETYI